MKKDKLKRGAAPPERVLLYLHGSSSHLLSVLFDLTHTIATLKQVERISSVLVSIVFVFCLRESNLLTVSLNSLDSLNGKQLKRIGIKSNDMPVNSARSLSLLHNVTSFLCISFLALHEKS